MRRTRRRSWLLWGLGGFTILLSVAALAFWWWVWRPTPNFLLLRESVLVPIRRADGTWTERRFGPRAPGWVPYHRISPALVHAVVASEDTGFFGHQGIDLHEIRTALKKDWEEGRFARGASTLTQQLLKNVYLGQQKTVLRKIREIILAPRLEKELSKKEILAFYLNLAEWGPGLYGCREAAQHYFSLPPNGLSAKQSAFLALLLPSPRKYHRYFSTRALTPWAEQRLDQILNIQLRMGVLTAAELDHARQEPLWPSVEASVEDAEEPDAEIE